EGGTDYSLVVTRNVEFDTEGNDTVPTAQPLLTPETSGRRWAMGSLASSRIDHSGGFSSPFDLVANGSTEFTNTVAQLTDGGGGVGSVFSRNTVSVANFDTGFTFQMTPGTFPMADGITFTIQSAGNTALGGSGNGMGYVGIAPSVAITFDTFDPYFFGSISH